LRKLLFVLLVFSSLIFAQTPEIVTTAFAKMEADSVHQYSYMKSVQSTETLRIMKYDPTREGSDCWELVSINGENPNKKELKAFYKEMSGNSDSKNKSISMDSDDMINFSIVNDLDNHIEYSFNMEGDEDDKMADALTCTISLNKIDSTITKMTMYITETLSPMVSVKIEEFKIEMNFDKLAQTGSTLIQETKTRIKGQAMVFKKIDENVTETYFDYKLVD